MNNKKRFARLGAMLLAAALISASVPLNDSLTATLPVYPSAQAVAASARQPDVSAKSAIVIDADTMSVLYEKNADERRAMASTTKLMTLLLAVEKGNMNEIITVPDSASTVPSDSTRVPVYPGENMPFKDLVYALMIKSGNDAANAIGTLVSGSVAAFVSDMNARAGAMGLSDTNFKNAHGYPADGHYSSARDLAKLMARVIDNPTAMKVLTTRSYTMASGKTIANTYAILNPDSPYYYKYAVGGKTGYCASSGQCFCCVAEKDGHTLISVVLHSALTKPEKWIDTKAILEYAFSL
ncbi:MAG: D-alanyl-D-alanine carboxypeptidase family protein [Clostridia bacterium]|nr:D-alanyl-D-alanine carboxypeptidase family protein [Clostridia bacterium]